MLWTSASHLATCACFTFVCIAKKMNKEEERATHSGNHMLSCEILGIVVKLYNSGSEILKTKHEGDMCIWWHLIMSHHFQ